MNLTEVIDFLKPQDVFQLGFLTVILILTVGTMYVTHTAANPKKWERKWNRGTPDDTSDDLDIEHGSVTDLCNAVATWPEKLAGIMPGMLLVFGLLGTFLGLGIALNAASNILGSNNAMSASGAAGSMSDLLQLLNGLGTKFKTSTWGIIGFISLTIFNNIHGFDEKRLGWVIEKVKKDLDSKKILEKEILKEKESALFFQISKASECIVSGISSELLKLMQIEKAIHQAAMKNLTESVVKIRNDLALEHQLIKNIHEVSIAHDKELHESSINATKNIHEINFLQNQNFHASIIEYFSDSIKKIRNDLSLGNRSVQDAMKATQSLSQGMLDFTEKTQDIIASMGTAAVDMANGADRVGQGADKIGMATDALVNAVGDFKKEFTTTLEGVRTGLGNAIQDMSKQASETLERGSQQLGDATKEISTALGILSSDVKQTMSEVKGSIKESLDIQQRSSNLFIESSQVLNENVAETTNLVNKLGDDITSGLSAVSNAGQTMTGIGRSLKISVEQTKDLPDILVKLENALSPLKSTAEQHIQLLDAITILRTESKTYGAAERQKITQYLVGTYQELKKLPGSLAPLNAMSNQHKELLEAIVSLRGSKNQHDGAQPVKVVA